MSDIKEIKEYAKTNKVPIIKDEGLAYLLKTITERGAKRILELGTAVGYSSIQMASLDEEIEIDTIERNDEMAAVARENIKMAGLEDRIHLHHMDIKEFQSDTLYDLVFVDAAKGQYGNYLEQFLDNVSKDGIFFFDNMVFHDMIYHIEEVKNRNTRQLLKKILRFRQSVQDDARFDIIMRDDIGDGILILSKKEKDYEG